MTSTLHGFTCNRMGDEGSWSRFIAYMTETEGLHKSTGPQFKYSHSSFSSLANSPSLETRTATFTCFTCPSFTAVVLAEVVPKCDYHPSYAYIHKVKRFTGVYNLVDSFVYPDDHTELDVIKRNIWKAAGNPIIDQSVSCHIVRYSGHARANGYTSEISVCTVHTYIYPICIGDVGCHCGI